jgi:hypothetical protein
MRTAVMLGTVLLAAVAMADGPSDNIAEKVRPIPPKGIAVPDDVRAELRSGCDELAKVIDGLRTTLKSKPELLALLPDVEIFHKAVDWPLRYDEFYETKEFAIARRMLANGHDRAAKLAAGDPKWTRQTGLVVRGYRSKIDGSVQPYGLSLPASCTPESPKKYRLDVWWHGRGEKLTELSFINERQTKVGEFAPLETIVLYPYGRYCNANKFAGEVDTFEALDHVKQHYKIDENRIVARGFSMGGAACWQFATHFPSVWCAANPGAGFAESAEFLNVFQNEKVQPPEWEKTLWHWYDATDYAGNLFNLPTVAYSGEIDKQKQAADIMAKAMKAEGLDLVHLIGPGTAHKYHPETKKEVAAKIDALAAKGRAAAPQRVKFTTFTLTYNKSFWLTVDGLESHWKRADVDAQMNGVVATRNVNAFTIYLPYWQGITRSDTWTIDGQSVDTPKLGGDAPWSFSFHKRHGKWQVGRPQDDKSLVKHHGLQGPIDDAFMDRFLMVRPTGSPLNEKVGAWANSEMNHAIKAWRNQFRGEAPVKDDTAVTDDDIRECNLILWGDPSSNKFLARVQEKLPIPWESIGIRFGPQIWAGENHLAIYIYPNPLNPNKYVVLNSGFTFREYDYLNNARQTPKLPDWAIVDVNTPPSTRWPGKVVQAGFFDEKWQWYMMR